MLDNTRPGNLSNPKSDLQYFKNKRFGERRVSASTGEYKLTEAERWLVENSWMLLVLFLARPSL